MSDLQCYNTACGKMFREEENNEDACQYHCGKPYFHDGYKEWTCCKLRSRDFSVFMSFKGCTKGRHSNVKIEETAPVQKEVVTETNNEPKQTEFVPPDSNKITNISIFESPSLKNLPSMDFKTSMICKYCKKEESTLDLNTACHYHKGVQIFHDAYKFWSCCQHKKFYNFDDFQKLPPCAKSERHELIPKIDYKENWFQAGDSITIALYGLKGARKPESKAILRGDKTLSVTLATDSGSIIFEKEWLLYDYVNGDNNNSKVTINSSNVQIVLKKSKEQFHWPKLVS